MADWFQQFSSALDARDAREKAHKPYIDAFTKLADRTSLSHPDPSSTSTPSLPLSQNNNNNPSSSSSSAIPIAALRAELATTQKARAKQTLALTAVQTELSVLKSALSTANHQLGSQRHTQKQLERRLRDREEELAGKRTIVSNAQDEVVALNLQLNVAEAKTEELKRENEELVRRWMERMGMEAEKVNRDSNWGV